MTSAGRGDSFWVDKLAFQAVLRSPDVLSSHRGVVWLLLSGGKPVVSWQGSWPPALTWEKRFCVIKSNILGFAVSEHADYEGAFLLENVTTALYNGREALTKEVIPFLPDEPAAAQQHVVYVTSAENYGRKSTSTPFILSVASRVGAEAWKGAIAAANMRSCRAELSALQQETKKQRSTARRDQQFVQLRDLQYKRAEEEMHLVKKELLLEIQSLREKTRRLQATGEVTEKVAAEYIDQKISEISALQGQIAAGLHEQALLSCSLHELREHASKQQCRIRTLELEKRQAESKYNGILCDLEEAKDNPSRLALMMSRFRNTMQRLGAENTSLKEENAALVRRFHEIEARFEDKFRVVRKVAEAGDVFDYLRKWLLCSENKILFYETGYNLDEDGKLELVRKIGALQEEIQVAAAVARSSYISLRAMLLGEQLKYYTRSAPTPSLCTFVSTALRRFGWIFGEIELAKAVKDEDGSHFPEHAPSAEDELTAPISERWYHAGGAEGSARFSLVKGVDVMRPVERLIPVSRLTALQSDLTLLSMQHQELQENYRQALDALSEYRSELRRLREQESIRLIAESFKTLRRPAKTKAQTVEEGVVPTSAQGCLTRTPEKPTSAAASVVSGGKLLSCGRRRTLSGGAGRLEAHFPERGSYKSVWEWDTVSPATIPQLEAPGKLVCSAKAFMIPSPHQRTFFNVQLNNIVADSV